MALAFPNPSRSYDSTVNCVRFSGHDSAIEVSFFVEVQLEPEILDAFDTQIGKIHDAAIKVYAENKGTYVYTLSPDSF
jgi:hypothetical protein